MKSWRVLLGVGAACAACCALPLVGGVATLATTASALLACADELAPLAWAAAGVALVAGALWFWRRQAARRAASCGCGPAACGTGAVHAND